MRLNAAIITTVNKLQLQFIYLFIITVVIVAALKLAPITGTFIDNVQTSILIT